jgi:hypothetical protein
MIKTIHKWFWAWDYDKEETWLNKMSAIGLQLVGIGYCTYHFEDGLPGEYTYRLAFLASLPGQVESSRYIRFVEDTGAEYIGSIFRWVYFRQRSDTGSFELFSDTDSRLKHISRLLLLIGVLFASNLITAINMTIRWAENTDIGSVYPALLGTACASLMGFGFTQAFIKYRHLKRDSRLFE